MLNKRRITFLIGLVFALIIFNYAFKQTATTPPWESSGRLVLAIHATPFLKSEMTLGLGIDNVRLYKKDGSVKKVTILTRRILLDPKSNNMKIFLDTDVPADNYSGFGFTLKSPELRNAWQQEEAPSHVSLAGENIRLKTQYKIEENKTTAIILAFETLQAIHEINENLIYLPVVQIETRFNPNISIIKDSAKITGGKIQNISTFGMDTDGRMRYNFRAKIQNKKIEPLMKKPATTSQKIISEEIKLIEKTSTSTKIATTTDPVLKQSTTTAEEQANF